MEREKLLKICNVEGKTLLDIGAGPLARVAAKDFGCNVTSIDLYRNKLEREKEKVKKEGLEDKISLEQENAANLPYNDDFFDVGISYGALHHTSEDKREEFVLETFRVASEKLCLAEFRKSTFPHSEDKFKRVDLEWLEEKLNQLGVVERHLGEEMTLFICFKSK